MHNTIAELYVARNNENAYVGENFEPGHSFGDALTFISTDPVLIAHCDGYKFIKLSTVVHGLMREATELAVKLEKKNPPIEIKDSKLSYNEPKNDIYIYWKYEGLIAQRDAMDFQRYAKRAPELYGFYLFNFNPETNKTTWKSWKNYWE